MSDDGQGTPPTGLDRVKDLKNKLAQLRDDIATVGASLKSVREERKLASVLCDKGKMTMDVMVAEKAKLDAKEAKLEAEKKELNDKIDATEAKLEALQQPLAPPALELAPKKKSLTDLVVEARVCDRAKAQDHVVAMDAHFSARLRTALEDQNPGLLAAVWEDYRKLPRTSTKQYFAAHGIQLRDPFGGDGSGLFHALQGARALVMKKLERDELAAYDCLATALAGRTHSRLVPFTIFTDDSPASSSSDAEAPCREPKLRTWAFTPCYLMDAGRYCHDAKDDLVSSVIAAMMDALTFLHERGVAHMDVKPSNIFVSEDGTARLGDFGSVRRLGARATSTTMAYVPQDMRRAEVHEYVASAQHDWWMLGMTAASMKTPRVGEGARDLSSAEVLEVLQGIGSKPARALVDKLVPQPAAAASKCTIV